MKERIRNILSKNFRTTINDDFSKNSTDEWDSLAQLNLIVDLEREFNISFTPQEMGAIQSFTDIVNIIEGKIDK